MTRALLQQALVALEKVQWPSRQTTDAIEAIRAHLAQPQGEPDQLAAEYERGRKAGITAVYDAMLAQPQGDTCKWTLDDEDSGTYASACGELWSFIDGGPAENRVRYCHGCGKPVELGVPAP